MKTIEPEDQEEIFNNNPSLQSEHKSTHLALWAIWDLISGDSLQVTFYPADQRREVEVMSILRYPTPINRKK